MQLAEQSEDPDRKMSPSTDAALTEFSLRNASQLFAGIVFVVIAAAMTALKTGEYAIWACVALLIVAGAVRVWGVKRYQARKAILTAGEAAQWQHRYQIGAMIQAAVIGIWCFVALFSNDDAVVHMICLSVTTGLLAGGAGRAYGRQSIFRLQAVLMFAPAVIALALRGTPYYVAMSV